MRRAVYAMFGFVLLCPFVFAQESIRIKPLNLGDVNADLVYTPLAPCRIIDTRIAGGIVVPLNPRNFKVAGTTGFPAQGGTSGGCGVPDGATSVLINFVAVNVTGGGNLKGAAFPHAIPATGSILNYQALSPNLNIANGVAFPICDQIADDCTSDITLEANGASTHVVADVLGYFKRFPKEQIVSAITAGPGILATGSIGDITLSANFSGTGATNTVARGDHKHYERTVFVSPIEAGTPLQNGTLLINTLTAITTASDTNPYLLKIEPGIYDVGMNPVLMKQYVDIEGSGENVTIIRGIGSNNANDGVVYGINNAELRFLTVNCVAFSTECTGMYNGADSPKITNVTLRSSGATNENIALYNDLSSSPTLTNVTAIAEGVGISVNYGIQNRSSSNPSMRNVTASCTSGQSCYGIANFFSSPHMVNVEVSAASAAGENAGLRNDIAALPIVEGLVSRATGGLAAYGIMFQGGSSARADGFSVVAQGASNSYGVFIQGSSPTLLNGYIDVSNGSVSNNAFYVVGTASPALDHITTLAAAPNGRGIFTTSHTGTIFTKASAIHGETFCIQLSTTTSQLRFGASQLWGGPVSNTPPGILTCVHSYNGNFAALTAGCL